MSSILRYTQDHPYRPPHWRWERSRLKKELDDDPDDWVKRCMGLRHHLGQANNDAQRARVLSRYKELGLAYDLWDDRAPNLTTALGRPASLSARHELEARLLARQPYADIRRAISVPVKTIEAYEQVFYNITDRIDEHGWVLNWVIGQGTDAGNNLRVGLPLKKAHIVLKAYAYYTGSPLLVDILTSTFSGGEPRALSPKTAAEVRSFLADDAKWVAQCKTALAMRLLRLDCETQGRLADLQVKLQEIEADGGTGAVDNFTSGIQALLGCVEPLMDRRPEPASVTIEQRSDERFAKRLGLPPPDRPTLENFEFPPVGAREKENVA